jgi:hypothetical protein
MKPSLNSKKTFKKLFKNQYKITNQPLKAELGVIMLHIWIRAVQGLKKLHS